MTERHPIYIGLDGGGSKTELLAAHSPDEELLTLFGPCANPSRVGFAESRRVLAALIHDAMDQLEKHPVASICAGIAGAGRAAEQRRIHEGLAAALPDEAHGRLTIVHDGDIALEAAFEGESGIMVIAGTGSVALARTEDHEFVRVGGWGYLVGDEGSGYALGSNGIRAIFHALDGGPRTAIQDKVARTHGLETADDLVHTVYEEKWPLQKAAPVVLEAADEGDAVALAVVDTQARLLAVQVQWLASRCTSIRRQIALMGGLVNHPLYRKALTNALLEELPGWMVTDPRNRPVVGAWRLARELAPDATPDDPKPL